MKKFILISLLVLGISAPIFAEEICETGEKKQLSMGSDCNTEVILKSKSIKALSSDDKGVVEN